jgi:hypothetical protein
MPEGESKQTLLGNRADGEEYVKHLMSFTQFMEKKGYSTYGRKLRPSFEERSLTLPPGLPFCKKRYH